MIMNIDDDDDDDDVIIQQHLFSSNSGLQVKIWR